MNKIKIAIIGIGNCASSLIQGIEYYKNKDSKDAIGVMHWDLGGYKPFDIEVVAAFDIDKRKVGKDVSEAIFALPNCTTVFCKDVPKTEAVQSVLAEKLDPENIHIGPSDYVPWQKDNKVCFIRMEGKLFGGCTYEY